VPLARDGDAKANPHARNETLARLLWEMSEEAVKSPAAASTLKTTDEAAAILPYPRSKTATGKAGLTLYAVSEANISSSEFGDSGCVTLATLAGVLARDSPQIYTLRGGAALTPAALQPNGDTTPLWLDDLQKHHGLSFSLKYLDDLKGLLKLFAGSGMITTFVSYDTSAAVNASIDPCCEFLK